MALKLVVSNPPKALLPEQAAMQFWLDQCAWWWHFAQPSKPAILTVIKEPAA